MQVPRWASYIEQVWGKRDTLTPACYGYSKQLPSDNSNSARYLARTTQPICIPNTWIYTRSTHTREHSNTTRLREELRKPRNSTYSVNLGCNTFQLARQGIGHGYNSCQIPRHKEKAGAKEQCVQCPRMRFDVGRTQDHGCSGDTRGRYKGPTARMPPSLAVLRVRP